MLLSGQLFAVTTLMTGITDSFGRGMTGWTPVSAETGTRAGDPQAASEADASKQICTK